jgi:hypothetical protein
MSFRTLVIYVLLLVSCGCVSGGTFTLKPPPLHPMKLNADEEARHCWIEREGGDQPYPNRLAGLKEFGFITVGCPLPMSKVEFKRYCAQSPDWTDPTTGRYARVPGAEPLLIECSGDRPR